MEKLHNLSIEELVDLLSTQTVMFIQMQTSGASDVEFEKCKQLIKDLQVEIESRKKSALQ